MCAWSRHADVDHGSAGKGARWAAVQDAEAIEVMRKVDTLVVDKTGTLTVGKPHWCR
jgi:cation transport ATPase